MKKLQVSVLLLYDLNMQIVNMITKRISRILCKHYKTIADVLKMYHPVFLVSCLESANLGGSATSCLNASILKSTFEVNCQRMARYHQVLPGRPLTTNWQANTELILAPQNSVSAVSRHSHLTVRRSFDFRELSGRATT